MRIVNDRVSVHVPATISHLGPAVDCLACAVSVRDRFVVRPVTGSSRLTVHGGTMDDSDAVNNSVFVTALRAGLEFVGAPQVGVDLYAHYRIDGHAGLGRDAAHAVAALLSVRALINEPQALTDDDVVALATEIDGRAPHVSAALYGGCRLVWNQDGAPASVACEVSETLPLTVLIPPGSHALSQRRVRRALPQQVPYDDAVFNVARMGLLVQGLAGKTELLMEATEDRLRQDYLRTILPGSTAVMDVLRDRGYPAVIAGGGPAVLVMASLDDQSRRELCDAGWKVLNLAVDPQGGVLI